jgi:lipopolysaccharide/colanic/teichoic acid biosynthesis glycosyltransferase
VTMLQAKSDVQPSNSLSIRQIVDSCLSAMVLAVLSPLLLVIAGSIFCETGLPILFTQQRVGRNGQLFRLLKFRTMLHETKGPALTVSGDPRVTRSGRFLRDFKLDEIPQLWNVVRAEMALVGPRPEVPEFVDLNEPIWHSVLRVRPGITDPASIAYRQEEKLLAKAPDPIRYYQETLLPAKLAMNLAYLHERSFWLDFKVILRTVRCVASPENGRITDTSDFSPRESK